MSDALKHQALPGEFAFPTTLG